jgi:hypothetical protein
VSPLSIRPQAESLEALDVAAGRCAFYAYKNIMIGVWIGQADLAAAQALERAAQTMVLRHPSGRAYVAIVVDGLLGPKPEAMPIFKKLMAERKGLGCLAYLLEGSGFWASGIRSMISNTYREGGGAARIKIGTTPQEIADWLSAQHAQTTGVVIAPNELCDVLTRARQLA